MANTNTVELGLIGPELDLAHVIFNELLDTKFNDGKAHELTVNDLTTIIDQLAKQNPYPFVDAKSIKNAGQDIINVMVNSDWIDLDRIDNQLVHSVNGKLRKQFNYNQIGNIAAELIYLADDQF